MESSRRQSRRAKSKSEDASQNPTDKNLPEKAVEDENSCDPCLSELFPDMEEFSQNMKQCVKDLKEYDANMHQYAVGAKEFIADMKEYSDAMKKFGDEIKAFVGSSATITDVTAYESTMNEFSENMKNFASEVKKLSSNLTTTIYSMKTSTLKAVSRISEARKYQFTVTLGSASSEYKRGSSSPVKAVSPSDDAKDIVSETASQKERPDIDRGENDKK